LKKEVYDAIEGLLETSQVRSLEISPSERVRRSWGKLVEGEAAVLVRKRFPMAATPKSQFRIKSAREVKGCGASSATFGGKEGWCADFKIEQRQFVRSVAAKAAFQATLESAIVDSEAPHSGSTHALLLGTWQLIQPTYTPQPPSRMQTMILRCMQMQVG
jgi:hypothetical protein